MQKEDPNLGLLSEQHKPCHQWCLFVTKLLSPFQTTSTCKCSMNQGEKNGVITNGSNKTQQGTRKKPCNEKKPVQWDRTEMPFPCFPISSLFASSPTWYHQRLCFNKYGSAAVCSPGPYLYSEVTSPNPAITQQTPKDKNSFIPISKL